MSLVWLKNLVFRPSPPPSPPRSPFPHHKALCGLPTEATEATSLLSSSRPPTSSYDSDIEAANSSTPCSSRWPRIDARIISDATIGLSDGLTVPFALTAGLSALGNTRVVIYGGLAELIAGAISMGLGGYLGAKCEL